MEFYEFPEDEIKKIKEFFPGLEYKSPGLWFGSLQFDRVYKDYRIIDNYEIGIAVPKGYPDKLPIVHEMGKRVQAIAEMHKLRDIADLHITSQNGACLCVRQEEKIKFPPGSDFTYFINELVAPYFYGLSYFKDFGKWPWHEYSHGALGILEHYAIDTIPQTLATIMEELVPTFTLDKKNWKKYRRQFLKPTENSLCLCGKSQPFSKCHNMAWKGLILFRKDLIKHRVDIYKAFTRPEKIPTTMSHLSHFP